MIRFIFTPAIHSSKKISCTYKSKAIFSKKNPIGSISRPNHNTIASLLRQEELSTDRLAGGHRSINPLRK